MLAHRLSPIMSAPDVPTEPFPLSALLPKRETTAASFLTKYPEYDGRGVKIAVLDSGIDPGAPGLQTTSDGKPKIIDLMDGSGAGDVDTSTVVEADIDGFITGLTGTKLKIPSQWQNPSGKYHIGVKNIYELFTKGMRERMAKEYTENEWQPMQKTAIAEAVRQLQEFERTHSDASADNTEEKLIREDLQSRVDFLKQLDKKFTDLGPTYDCVVFNDGKHWKGVVDTSGAGKLEDCTLLGNYRECLKYGTLSDRAPHGTHVASIAAAHFPNDPERNGVAPGAQIISICIADMRVTPMETGTALMRALVRVIESGCHVINMSYGEAAHYAEGRILDFIHEIVNKYGVIFVVAAANMGPALSTVWTPSTMHSSSMISVGAYVSPDMMAAEYSMLKKMPGMSYSWSSRGPTTNGDLGVSVTAPGGAITSVPNWCLKKSVLMNGTSMSSPNVAGCVCLLVSGLKARAIDYSPYSVRRSIENTALKSIQNYEPFTHGHGLIQVEKAFEHLTQFKDSVERDVRFHVTIDQNLGVYLRQPEEVANPSIQQISVDAIFLNDKQIDNNRKVDFEMNLILICDNEWITCPSFLHLTYGRKFSIKVDPRGLEDGREHFAFIRAYDTNCIEKGPVFHIPVSVIKPMKIPESKQLKSTQKYKPGYFKRQFVDIPSSVNSVVIRAKNLDPQESGLFVIHCQQLSPLLSNQTHSAKNFFSLEPLAENTYAIPLKSGRTLEICFGKWWSSIGESSVQLNVQFYGLQPSLDSYTMLSSEGISRLDIQSNFGYEVISPNILLQTYVQPLRPVESKVRPLTARDVIPIGRQIYENSKATVVYISCPLLSDVLFESEYDSQIWMIFDANTKQLLATGDAYPIIWNYWVKLEKGEYTVRMQIRHELVAQLDKLSDLSINVHQKLTPGASLSLYETYKNAITDGEKFDTYVLPPNCHKPVFVAAMTELPKGLTVAAGGYFSGHITFTKSEVRKKAEQFAFKYVVDSEPQMKPKDKDSNSAEDSADKKTTADGLPEKSLEEQFSEALIDLKISWISRLKGKSSEDVFTELQATNKANTQLLLARMQALDADPQRGQHLTTQINLANDVLDLIKVSDLIASLAVVKSEKKDTNNSTNNTNNTALKNLEKQKTTVLEALVKKGIAICDLIDAQTADSIAASNAKLSPTGDHFVSDANQVYAEICKLADPYDQKVAKFTERHALLHRHFGRAIKLFAKLQESKASHELELKTINAFKQLNWTHLEAAYNRSINVKQCITEHYNMSLAYISNGVTLLLVNDTFNRLAHRLSPIMSAPDVPTEPFPLSALLPKRETTAASFLTKYPEYDGRGVKIAVLDSGIDPGAPGLQITSDGKPKIIDLMDGSGAGDVDTSTVVEADIDGFITGLTGTKLKCFQVMTVLTDQIPSQWQNPSGKYHIGVKNIYELFTKGMRERMAKEYTENEWQPMQKTAIAEAVRQLQEFERTHSDASADNTEEKLIREDLQSRVDFLKQLDKKFTDLGPTYDCVVFNDGTHWKGIVDTSGAGKLEDCTLLGNYRECLKYGTLSDRAPHGTHVASIAAAHFPNEPEKNGVAPGAQIISICIGDTRVGSMETGTALMRALMRVIESGCHVINMSYGEAGHYAEGRILDFMHEIVNKYGVIFVASAANSGPALSTIGTPPTMHSSSIISVGAYVSPDMMAAEYSMRQKMPGMNYSWSSRGPTINGDLGVSVTGPGGAITSVPNWCLKKSVLMNGTSMSSPNVAGCVCLLVSGLKARAIDYSPYSVRRSIENTALKSIQNYEPFTHGHGLIQVLFRHPFTVTEYSVEKAFEHLTQFKDSAERDVRFHVTIGQNLGVYLRQPEEVANPSIHPISVDPIFLNDKQIDNKRKVDFEMNLSLICDNEWITCPSFLHLTYGSRGFAIKVDPRGLEDGREHFAFIRAYDTNCIEKGPVFHIPVSVMKPMKIPDSKLLESTQHYKPGYFKRQFVDIPSSVNSVVIRAKNLDPQESGSFVIHCQQLSPLLSNRTDATEKFFSLAPLAENTYAIPLKSGRTLEICFGRWWSSIGESSAQLSIQFYGLQPSLDSYTMLSSEGISRLDIQSNFGYEEISPNISLQTYVQPLRPVENKVRPLTARDVIPIGRQIYEISKPTDVYISCPLLSDVLYESEYDSQIWMIFDTNTKQFLATGDAYSSRHSAKLEKGEYTVRLQIRHELVAQLDKLSDLSINVHQKLTPGASLSLYETYKNAITDGKKFNTHVLRPNCHKPVFVAAMTEPPKGLTVAAGGYFSGHITFTKSEVRKKAEQFAFKYVVDSEPQKKPKDKDNSNGGAAGKESADKKTTADGLPEKSLEEQFSEALSDLKISWISKLKGKSSEDVFNELQATNKANTQLLLARMQALDADPQRGQHLTTQINLANDVLDLIKVNDLIASLAVVKSEKKDTNNSTNNTNNTALKNLEKQKTTVLEALVKKGIAICDLIDAQTAGSTTATGIDPNTIPDSTAASDAKLSPTGDHFVSDANQVFAEICKLTDPYDQIHRFKWLAVRENVAVKPARFRTHELELKTINAFKQLNWTHLEAAYNRSINVKFPKDYRLF
ncbi:unnamed protein product [Medioppia subpectinata]|uniref:Tripeptidyl-peptidase 2 n=1 Tax=Medioppia subpectinata TaxID=1979941 RepID=A0A7R9KIQ0_9ACAR|nr:unnamed protein product [Medioppia subpectinata]CAG2104207.1 unnamed protein product [Medioppia subpectinata]